MHKKTPSKIEIIKKIYGDMQLVNLFLYAYIDYNKVIKGKVYGRYLSGEIRAKRRLISKTEAKIKKAREIRSQRKRSKGDKQNVSTNNHTAVSRVYDR